MVGKARSPVEAGVYGEVAVRVLVGIGKAKLVGVTVCGCSGGRVADGMMTVVWDGTVVAVDAGVKVLEGLATTVWVGVLMSIGINSLNMTGADSQLAFAARLLVIDLSRS